MASQIFGDDQAVLLPRPAEVPHREAAEPPEVRGGAIRGFFFAMLFNVFLLLLAAIGWELWRYFVR